MPDRCVCPMRSAIWRTGTWRCSLPPPVGPSTSCRGTAYPRRWLPSAQGSRCCIASPPTGSLRSRGWTPAGSAPRARCCSWRDRTWLLSCRAWWRRCSVPPPARGERSCCTATSTPRTCWSTTPGSASSTSTRPEPGRPRPSSAACWRGCGARAPGDEIDADTAAAAADAFLASYGPAPEHRDLLWYAAAALLVERAVRAVNRVDVRTLAVLEQVLATALRWAEDRTEERP